MNENVLTDEIAMNAEAVVRAAIAWRWRHQSSDTLTEFEWRLFDACNRYGDKYRGLRG